MMMPSKDFQCLECDMKQERHSVHHRGGNETHDVGVTQQVERWKGSREWGKDGQGSGKMGMHQGGDIT